MVQRGAQTSVADFAEAHGLVRVATSKAPSGEEAAAFERPSLTPAQSQALRRRFGLDSVERVAILGNPPWLLAPLQTLLPSTRFHTSWEPGRGKLDVAFHIGSMRYLGLDGLDAPRMLRRLEGGGRLVAVWRSVWVAPSTPRKNLEREGFVAQGKPRPPPIGDEGWLAQTFAPAAVEKKAPRAAPPKEGATPKERAQKKRAPKSTPTKKPAERKKTPPLPSGKRQRPTIIESEEDVAAHLSQHARRASVIDKLARASSSITSLVGDRTWARDGETWPEIRDHALVHELSIRVDELPFAPDGLRGIAFLSVFSGGDALTVRSYPSLDGLVPLRAPKRAPAFPSRRGGARAIRWREVLDHPDRFDAPEVLATGRVKIDRDWITSAYDAELVPHRGGTKIGGWPTHIQHTLSPKGFVLQCGEPLDAGLYYLHRKGRGWTSVAHGH